MVWQVTASSNSGASAVVEGAGFMPVNMTGGDVIILALRTALARHDRWQSLFEGVCAT